MNKSTLSLIAIATLLATGCGGSGSTTTSTFNPLATLNPLNPVGAQPLSPNRMVDISAPFNSGTGGIGLRLDVNPSSGNAVGTGLIDRGGKGQYVIVRGSLVDNHLNVRMYPDDIPLTPETWLIGDLGASCSFGDGDIVRQVTPVENQLSARVLDDRLDVNPNAAEVFELRVRPLQKKDDEYIFQMGINHLQNFPFELGEWNGGWSCNRPIGSKKERETKTGIVEIVSYDPRHDITQSWLDFQFKIFFANGFDSAASFRCPRPPQRENAEVPVLSGNIQTDAADLSIQDGTEPGWEGNKLKVLSIGAPPLPSPSPTPR